MQTFHVHLVSDSTGETVSAIARAAVAQFDVGEHIEHVWSLIRTQGQIDKVLESIRENPGVVMYTIVDPVLKKQLKKECIRLGIPCVSVLSKVVSELSDFLGQKTSTSPGRQHELDDEYFSRVDAINFALSHDDGQGTWGLEDEADVVLVGVSRTSKSPTCVYLAYRGLRAANVPFVGGCPFPEDVENLQGPLIVGLTIDSDRLVQIRRSRLLSINETTGTNYVDVETVKAEILESKRLFLKHKWPVIDVTRRSVEETAANIIQMYQERKQRKVKNG